MASIMKVSENGDKRWYVDGKCHREGGLPAIELADGHKEWYVDGKLHREEGLPAIELANGDKKWYVDGLYHRDGGLPAVELANGDKKWWVNGKRHREGGLPAVELANGDKEWWVNGVRYYPNRWTLQPLINDMVGQECVISLETIQKDSEVCKCGVCHSLSLFTAMEEWLRVNSICPHCRSEWTNWVKYRN